VSFLGAAITGAESTELQEVLEETNVSFSRINSILCISSNLKD